MAENAASRHGCVTLYGRCPWKACVYIDTTVIAKEYDYGRGPDCLFRSSDVLSLSAEQHEPGAAKDNHN